MSSIGGPLGMTPGGLDVAKRLAEFMTTKVLLAEVRYRAELAADEFPWATPDVVLELREEARAAGLWNLFLAKDLGGAGYSNLDFAYMCEILGWVPAIGPSATNCAAPDTGNMEILARFGSPEQRDQWLKPLLEAEIRSAFAMTEPAVASSDATNIATAMQIGDQTVRISGRKWFISGAGNRDCKVLIVLGRSDPDADRHRQHSMVVVPVETPGVRIIEPQTVYGYREAPHGHCVVEFDDATVPRSAVLGEPGSGFAIAQSRLGPGRIHHCMRLLGMAERALQLMCDRAKERVAFGRALAEQGSVRDAIAVSRVEIDQARLLVLKTAARIDEAGNQAALQEIAAIKVVVPTVVTTVIDRAIQVHGAMGFSGHTPLAELWAYARTVRVADGPDEVHRRTVAKLELNTKVNGPLRTIASMVDG